MDATKNSKVGDSHGATAPQIADPFAVDLFAAPHADVHLVEESGVAHILTPTSSTITKVAASWHVRLPAVSSEQAQLSHLTQTLPVALTADARRTLVRTLARFTNQSRELAAAPPSIELLSARETGLTTGAHAAQTYDSRSVFITLAVEPDAARLAFVLPTNFAVRLIDCVLGGSGGDARDEESARELSVVEQAVIEFLCLNLVQQLNREVGSNLLRFVSLGSALPAWMLGDPRAETTSDARGVLLIARITMAPSVECLARGFVPAATLRALDASTDKLLCRQRQAQGQSRAQLFKTLAADVRLRLRIGETLLSATDVTEIERGDVVLIAEVYADSGRALVFAGDGDNVRLAGRLQMASGADAYAFQLETIDSAQPTLKERWRMNEARGSRSSGDESSSLEENEPDEEAAAESAARLENLMLTIHVEIAARRISLDELAGLAPDQIIELGCRATDPVELIIEDRPVARGELVDIEGRLGVRITHVLR